MTAEVIESQDSDIDSIATLGASNRSDVNTRSPDQRSQIDEICDFLSFNEQIIFKSQQIDDPELLRDEKVKIAREIYRKSAQTFLMRFGSFLDEQHLATFAQIVIANKETNDEIAVLLTDYRNKLHTRKRDVKNRRYAAMQQLISDGEYFSEQEMMKRAPELYQELIGQYLSDAEKKQRDEYDVKNTTFSGILMHTMEQQQMQDVLKLADKQNVKSRQLERAIELHDISGDDTTQSTNSSTDEKIEEKECNTMDDEVPVSFRQQWGNFDNEQVACSTSTNSHQAQKNKREKHKQKQITKVNREQNTDKFITAGERDLLRQEFIGIMHEQFLSGGDKDFDYTQVDDNTQLDDLSQINQDKEDAYFEESDYSDEEGSDIRIEAKENLEAEESDDDLDVFMNHLNKHHSLQK
ncbi:coiled-coil domain-containing protein 97 [Bactrocera neohumeralis]|uniref:coiled-coil domain-containing protein 97 n=1 Tax=Bactrocera neohumeralis TaxID=98809 RepID=UPI002165F350|nr:coiled-coil domain-containing protein 97 [Bactrocera neohumeralis]